MLINASEIALFKNLSEFEFGNLYYDFHNNFDCSKISFVNNTIELLLTHVLNSEIIYLKFSNAEIANLNFEINAEKGVLTLDNFYRGRYVSDGSLLEFNSNQKSYFYLEFYEGQTVEFFCDSIELDCDAG